MSEPLLILVLQAGFVPDCLNCWYIPDRPSWCIQLNLKLWSRFCNQWLHSLCISIDLFLFLQRPTWNPLVDSVGMYNSIFGGLYLWILVHKCFLALWSDHGLTTFAYLPVSVLVSWVGPMETLSFWICSRGVWMEQLIVWIALHGWQISWSNTLAKARYLRVVEQ